MSEVFTCDDKAQLVAYLYDEVDPITRQRVDEHLRVCPACAREVAGLTDVRHELATWLPPVADLGFTVVPARGHEVVPAPVLRPARWWQARALPPWAQAAAAVLVFAAGLSIANLQIRYGADGVVVTTGWMTPASQAPARASQASATPVSMPAAPDTDWRTALATLESSLRQEIEAQRPALAATEGADAASPRATGLTTARVADLIAESERRQRQELALRLTQFGRDLEVQRRTDLVRINQGFGQFEGRAGAEIARQRQMLDYIMRVSAPPPQ
jgi:hypothetical protein